MRVFVTGASGFIGSAVVPELIGAGHEVVGLARSEASAEVLAAAGAGSHRGTLEDLDALRAGAEASDAVIHLAFVHDFSRFEAAMEIDRRAVETLGAALEGSGRPLVIASGLLGLGGARPLTERDLPVGEGGGASGRQATARFTLDLAERGVRSSVLRLSPTVHGEHDHGFVPALIAIAREKGVSAYVGDGANRWPGVHVADAARLFRLAVEKAPAGSVLHAVADEGVPARAIAEEIGRQLAVPVASVPAERAAEHFGWIGPFFAADVPASGALTRELLGWRPAGPPLLDDLAQGHYFAASPTQA